MLQGRLAARNRVLLSMILPVLVVGLTIIAASAHFWTIPVITYIEERARTELEIASDLGIMRCEDRLNDLIILRLDENPGMVESVKKWTIKEVLAIADRLPDIHIMIIENKTILGSSETGLEWQPPILSRGGGIISTAEIHGEAVRFHYRYFPVWNWHIVSFIHEKDFMEPISSANRTVYAISMGVLLLVSAAILFIFERMVNSPLKRIINAARGIAQGRYTMLRIRRQDEIGQVAHAFDTMVKSLEDDKEWIHAILSKLKESEERYRLLTENSLANIIMIQGGRLIYANRTTTATSGYSADELYRMEILDLIHPDDCDLVREKVFGGMNSEKMVPDRYEFRYLTKQGETRWLEMLSVPSLYRGQPAMLGHAIDITDSVIARQEQNKLEEKLIQAQKMEALGTIVGAVAHDLNNILAGLVGYPDLLLLQLPQGSPLRKYVGAIQQSGQRAAAIVQDLLTMVRRGVIVKEVVSLNQIILSYMLSPEFERLKSDNPRVEFRTDLEPDLLNISGSRIHLLKTIMNLIANAAEASLEGGLTTIKTENRYVEPGQNNQFGGGIISEGEYVVLSVSDNGVGIPDEDLARIFEPFFTRKVMGRSGTGLGMAVVWSTVQDHRGYIRVNSEEGKGTLFDLYLPATRENLPDKRESVSLQAYRGTETILVVDDLKEQRELAREMLSGLGYRIDTAGGGAEALVYFERSGPPDLVVLDMIMEPGMDGLDTYRRLIELNPRQKAIITSGFSETDRVREVQILGARCCILKPFTMEKLAVAVREELDANGEQTG